ncbi:MAG: molybdenum cofactor guanylyltransferase [Flavobacteriaceae bacterium]|nr:molybdenum cofactor guanylyltransferase [Flavobacteriaceae bacterium]
MIQKKNITALLLAGGKSSRMGTDKGFITLNGISFMERIISAVKPFVGQIMIISNDSSYDTFNIKRVSDIIPNSGPLAGIFSGLFYSESEVNLVLSCDVPLINDTILNILIDGYNSKYDVIQLESQGKTMPLIALYKKQCMHPFLESLKNGERRLTKVVGELNTKSIVLDSSLNTFVRNINTLNELKEIKHELEH